jgi:hypothetical protein
MTTTGTDHQDAQMVEPHAMHVRDLNGAIDSLPNHPKAFPPQCGHFSIRGT